MDAMLAAHIRFELDRWTGDALAESVAGEVAAAFLWLERVRLDDIMETQEAVAWVDRFVFEAPLSDETIALVGDAVRAVHATALADRTTVGEIVSRSVFDRYAGTVIGMTGLRQAVIDQITTSEVYSQLISHVLYQGIKNYLLSESVFARRVPGASSLMRLGQSALSSAAPDLGKSIDRQLTSFVNANISESIRESRRYLDTVVDDEVLWSVAGEVRDSNADSTVANAAELVPAESLDEFVASGVAAWLHVRGTPFLREATTSLVAELLARAGDRPIAELLGEAGLTPERVTDQICEGLAPIIERAAADGFLEQRIRAQLEPFYSSYRG
jgi:hypothetical protein